MSSPDLIRHLRGERLGRFPVWMMRQAGRYLPSYREIRSRHSFWEMVTSPEVAEAVSLLPVRELSVDAVILFSDILSLPYGLGLPIEMKEAVGPVVVNPLRKESDFSIFSDFLASRHTAFVGETLIRLRKSIAPSTTLIGFAGAPWTVGCYLIQGQGKNDFAEPVRWMREAPASLSQALGVYTEATQKYLEYQIDSGAQLVQLFDTWLPRMSVEYFSDYYVPQLNQIFQAVKKRGVPVIYFAKGITPFLDEFSRLEADVISIGSEIAMKDADERLKKRFSLQGNLDPESLFRSEAEVRLQTRRLVQEARELARPAIINLGHGILPPTKVENARAFIDEARALWI